MGKIITAPENYTYGRDKVSVFLAGGITGAADWQRPVAERIASNTPNHITIFNPRRKEDFSFTDKEMSREQIEWEFAELESADIILFWFPASAACPITLFELGKELMKQRLEFGPDLVDVYVGVEPGYVRAFDVETQVGLMFPNAEIYDSLDEMVSDVLNNFED